jgi:hypothetical protein
MGLLSKTMRIFIVLAMVAIYSIVVWLGLTERSRRSLSIAESTASTNDFVIINTTVTSIDTAQGLLHERIRLVPEGKFALDKTTPATDLKLLINSASGKQTVIFPKGERIFPIEFTSILTGNQNRYPFDTYMTYIDVLVTAPAAKVSPVVPEENLQTDADPLSTTLVVGTSDLDHSETISINEHLAASIPGVRFEGDVAKNDRNQVMRATISMRRAYNVITVSMIVMSVMSLLAISVLGMVMHVTSSPNEMTLIPLSLCVSLIFGLPALRNVQPGVPAVGVLSDYISFIWAEFIVSTSAIALAWTWITRSRRDTQTN